MREKWENNSTNSILDLMCVFRLLSAEVIVTVDLEVPPNPYPTFFPFSWRLMLIKSRICLDTGAHVRRHFALCATLTGHRWWTTSRCRDGLNNLCFFCVGVDGENKNYFLLISKFASRYSMAEVRQKVTRKKKCVQVCWTFLFSWNRKFPFHNHRPIRFSNLRNLSQAHFHSQQQRQQQTKQHLSVEEFFRAVNF